MSYEILSLTEREKLLREHKGERDRRRADRIKVVLLRDDGWSYKAIAEALFLSDEGVRKQLKAYEECGTLAPANGGSSSALTVAQTAEILTHLESHLYTKALDICDYVHRTHGIRYSVSGMTDWLQNHGFSFHQPASVPAKADGEAQQAFIEHYENLKHTLPDDDHILFIDGVHPTHAVRLSKGWIRKGKRKEIPTNGGQKRINILGALNLAEMTVHTQHFDTLNAPNFITFLTMLLTTMPKGTIHLILDQARYQKCNELNEWLEHNPRIKLHYLPAYSPNLNTIERLWKLMHEHTTNNIYHATFKQFTEKITEFFETTFPKNARNWIDQLSDNFRPIGSPLLA